MDLLAGGEPFSGARQASGCRALSGADEKAAKMAGRFEGFAEGRPVAAQHYETALRKRRTSGGGVFHEVLEAPDGRITGNGTRRGADRFTKKAVRKCGRSFDGGTIRRWGKGRKEGNQGTKLAGNYECRNEGNSGTEGGG